MTGSLAEAKASAEGAYIAADLDYRQAWADHRDTQSAAIAELVKLDPAEGFDALGWLHERTGPARARLDAAEQELERVRIEQLAIAAADHAETESAKAQAIAGKARKDAVRYADRLDAVDHNATVALLLAHDALKRLGVEVKIK